MRNFRYQISLFLCVHRVIGEIKRSIFQTNQPQVFSAFFVGHKFNIKHTSPCPESSVNKTTTNSLPTVWQAQSYLHAVRVFRNSDLCMQMSVELAWEWKSFSAVRPDQSNSDRRQTDGIVDWRFWMPTKTFSQQAPSPKHRNKTI